MQDEAIETAATQPGPESYERYFVATIGRPMAEDLLDLARVKTGEHVLDVACGTGIVARLAALKVGRAGTVTGVDLNPGMIAEARRAAMEHPEIDWHVADAASLPLPERQFDAVLCQMGLQFFDDKLPALREMRRVLKPGGRIIITAPGAKPDIFAVMDKALAPHVGPEVSGFLDTVFALQDPEAVAELMRGAGIKTKDVRRRVKTLDLPAPADFLWQYVKSTPIAVQVFQKTEPAERAAIESHFRDGCAPFRFDGGMRLNVDVLTATGTG